MSEKLEDAMYAGTIEGVDDEIRQQAIEKRPYFLESLENASTMDDIKKAVEAYAIEDNGQKLIVNHLEGAYSEENIYDGVVYYNSLMSALNSLETRKDLTLKDIADEVDNYAVEMAVARVLNVTE